MADKDKDARATEPEPEPTSSAAASAAYEAMMVFDALHRLAIANLQSAPTSATAPAWREVANACAVAIGEELPATATPVPGRPAFVVPPARGGATQVPHRPPLSVPPTQRGPQGVGASVTPAEIKAREDVQAEIARVAEKAKRGR